MAAGLAEIAEEKTGRTDEDERGVAWVWLAVRVLGRVGGASGVQAERVRGPMQVRGPHQQQVLSLVLDSA